MANIDIKKLNNTTKILFILLVIVMAYLAIFVIMRSFYPLPRMGMMGMMSFSNTSLTITNIIPLVIAIAIGFLFSFYLFKLEANSEELKIIQKALSEDEKLIVNEIEKAGEITQDSLRFRLNWSKAKISTILTNLDKMNLIQRERTGKTYKVYLQK